MTYFYDYFFICGERIRAFSDKNEYEEIINITKEFFKYELKNNVEIPLDDTFREDFNIQSELLNDIVNYV